MNIFDLILFQFKRGWRHSWVGGLGLSTNKLNIVNLRKRKKSRHRWFNRYSHVQIKNRGGLERSGGFWMTELAELMISEQRSRCRSNLWPGCWELAAGYDGYGCPYSKWQFKLQLLYGYGVINMVIDYSNQQMMAGTTIFTPGWFQTEKLEKNLPKLEVEAPKTRDLPLTNTKTTVNKNRDV